MPLLIICGYPSSGKSKFSRSLMNQFLIKNPELKISLINDESLHLTKLVTYQTEEAEKEARSSIRSEVGHLLSRESLTIVDSMNYIKGFRYEISCIAKAVGTLCALCWVITNKELCVQWNAERLSISNDGYDPRMY